MVNHYDWNCYPNKELTPEEKAIRKKEHEEYLAMRKRISEWRNAQFHHTKRLPSDRKINKE